MFVSGFTIARNVVRADYPLKEAVFSILPLVDEMVIAVGQSDDDTLSFVRSFDSPKIRIIETVWDDQLREGGKVLAVETNKALDATNEKADWCFYIQADECVHEQYHKAIRQSMELWKDHPRVEGLLFDYLHFYGSYDYVADSRNWYRKEIRIVRRNPLIRSYKDAQGFRIDGRKLLVKPAGASIYHYGWVKHPEKQLEKLKQARKLWHSDEFIEKAYADMSAFDFSVVDSLKKFTHKHPSVMQNRIDQKNWYFEHDVRVKRLGFRKRLLYAIERLFGWRIGEHRNYKII